jgi:hypothetical protein
MNITFTKADLLDWQKTLPFEEVGIENFKYSLYHSAVRANTVTFIDGNKTKILKDNGRK